MNTQSIGRHYNMLLQQSEPFIFNENCSVCGPKLLNKAKELSLRIEKVLEMNLEAVDLIEIKLAAEEKREANLCRPSYSPYNWREPIPWKATFQLWDYCKKQIKEVIDAHNKEYQDKYEQYRQACIQGVAISPEEK